MSPAGTVDEDSAKASNPRTGRVGVFAAIVTVAPLLLFGVPWCLLVWSPSWPAPVSIAGTAVLAAGLVTLIITMQLGHGRRGVDGAAVVGDITLGLVWLLFTWSVLGGLVRLILMLAGIAGTDRAVTIGALAVVVVLAVAGYVEAMRVPRVRSVEVTLPRLGPGFDGLRIVVLADTHFGPINRRAWGIRVVRAVNGLAPDVVCHAGDLADGPVARRRAQVDALGDVRAPLGKFYITGNHEYFSEAQQWLDHMAGLGWAPMHNRHRVLTRGDDRLIVAGIDDPTGLGSGLDGHGPDLAAALDGADPDLPVVLLAHQPKQVTRSAEAGIDLQISGHTHGGQIWPFHYLVRLEQGILRGLSRHGDRTQLYTCGGTGFWGPPFRVFAPSELTVLTLRTPAVEHTFEDGV